MTVINYCQKNSNVILDNSAEATAPHFPSLKA